MTNNVLEESSILNMTLAITFGGDTTLIWLAGVRLIPDHY